MSAPQLPAQLVVEGVGLLCPCEVVALREYACDFATVPTGARGFAVTQPDASGRVEVAWLAVTGDAYALLPWSLDELEVRLTAQTALVLALKLDQWERMGGRTTRWAADLAGVLAGGVRLRTEVEIEALVARLRAIGEDAMIRRVRGWGVEAGTLCQVNRLNGRWAMVDVATEEIVASTQHGTDPDEARTAIWREVCSAR